MGTHSDGCGCKIAVDAWLYCFGWKQEVTMCAHEGRPLAQVDRRTLAFQEAK